MSTGIERMAYELAGRISEEMTEYHTYDPQSVVADELLNLIRAVVQDEIRKAAEQRPSLTVECCRADGKVHVCQINSGRCCYTNNEVCPDHG